MTILYLELLEDRLCPVITYHGGPILAGVAVTEILVGNAQPYDIGPAVATVAGYGVTGGSVVAVLHVSSLPDIQALVRSGQIPYPDGLHSMVLVLGGGQGAFHTYQTFSTFTGGFPPFLPVGLPVAYADNPQGASHEIEEAATDPFLSGWYDGNTRTGECSDGGMVDKVNTLLAVPVPAPAPTPQVFPLFQEMALDLLFFQIALARGNPSAAAVFILEYLQDQVAVRAV